MKGPCMCGSEECKRCHPSHFRDGQYQDPDHWCDVCQRFTGAVCESCEWCGRQVCGACMDEHREQCENGGEPKGSL